MLFLIVIDVCLTPLLYSRLFYVYDLLLSDDPEYSLTYHIYSQHSLCVFTLITSP